MCCIAQPKKSYPEPGPEVRVEQLSPPIASVTFKGLDNAKISYEVSISIGKEIPRIFRTLKDSLRNP